jgi:hypothetical protein
MDPFIQLVKELLESSDPHIKVVDCLSDSDHASAKSGSHLTVNPPNPKSPDDLPGSDPK